MFGNGNVDESYLTVGAFKTGSIEGDGLILLGSKNLTVGTNNLSTTFSGLIADGGINGGTGGSLTQSGTGTLILSGANTYTGATTVSSGILRAANKTGSATGSGQVQVNGGSLGGGGMIAGPITVATGASLRPSIGSSNVVTLTAQSALTLEAGSTYIYKLSTQKAKADQVIANGVTIQSGAQFNFTPQANKHLAAGTVFTALSNTAASPISGTFTNLADGSTLTAGPNKLLVSYTGGDGNDLTLTVQ